MNGWDERHKAPIAVWDSIFDARIDGRQRHIISPSGNETFTLDVLVDPRPSDTLLVVLHGSLDRTIYELPRFEWMGTMAHRNESVLYLSDPTITASERLRLGWYVGSANDDVTERYSRLVRSVAVQCGATRVLFFGFSGGGFAALSLASLMPGTTAIALSPQTSIKNYYPQFAQVLAEDAFPASGNFATVEAQYGKRVSLLERYADKSVNSSFIYVQNEGDLHHMRRHYEPFRALTEGRTGAEFVLRHDSNQHSLPPKTYLHELLDECVLRQTSDSFSQSTY